MAISISTTARTIKVLTTSQLDLSEDETRELAERLGLTYGDADYTLTSTSNALAQLEHMVSVEALVAIKYAFEVSGASHLAFIG